MRLCVQIKQNIAVKRRGNWMKHEDDDGAGKSTGLKRQSAITPNLVRARDPTTWTITRHDGPNHLGS